MLKNPFSLKNPTVSIYALKLHRRLLMKCTLVRIIIICLPDKCLQIQDLYKQTYHSFTCSLYLPKGLAAKESIIYIGIFILFFHHYSNKISFTRQCCNIYLYHKIKILTLSHMRG